MADVTIYKGNFGENIAWALFISDGVTPFNLTGYTVTVKVWSPLNPSNPVVSAAAVKNTPNTLGTVYYVTTAADFPQVGNYLAAFTATASGVDVTFEPFTLQVLDNA